MKARIVEALLWSVTLAALALAAITSQRVLRSERATVPIVWPAPSPNASASPDSLDVLAARIVDGDVFRLDRRPTSVPYRVAADTGAGGPPPPPVPKPVLTLVGIVGGPPWAALVDGVPAHDGTVLLHAGDTLGGLRVRTVSAAEITITGLDTVWHLPTKRD